MAKKDKYSIKDLKQEFPTDKACLDYLFDSLHSRECSCGGTYKQLYRTENGKRVGRRQFQCSKCRYQIAPTKGTIFEKSSTPMFMWFHAIFIFSNAKSGISAKELERQLGVTYKTAWRMLTLIRKSLVQKGRRLKGGDIEMDETYFGGRGDGGENNIKIGEAMKSKSAIIGAVQRGKKMKAQVIPNVKTDTVKEFMDKNIAPRWTRLLTDSSNRYEKIAKEYRRESVNHSIGEYVRGSVHINNIESFWSHFKRSIKGTHKSVSKKYLQSYVDGFVFHYNERNDRSRFDALLGRLTG